MAQSVYRRDADDMDDPPSGREEGDLAVKGLPVHNFMVALLSDNASLAILPGDKGRQSGRGDRDFHILLTPDII